MRDRLPDFDLDTYLPYRLTVIAARLSTELSQQYKKQFDITIPEWRVILNLGYSGVSSVRDIEKRVSLEKSKASRAVTRLEAKGYLTKTVDETDRRLLKLALTEKGADLLAQLIPLAIDYRTRLEAALGDQMGPLQAALDCLEARDDDARRPTDPVQSRRDPSCK